MTKIITSGSINKCKCVKTWQHFIIWSNWIKVQKGKNTEISVKMGSSASNEAGQCFHRTEKYHSNESFIIQLLHLILNKI